MTQDLLLAILAMDSYNRKYNQGLDLDSVRRVGTATVSSDTNAILGRDSSGNLIDQASSFFAQSYILDGGQKVIAYRGTDSALDAITGWPLAIGDYTVAQAKLAAQFYQSIAAAGSTGPLDLSDLYDANILLTGHSLGGGLAGFVGGIYGQWAELFDSMAYGLSASSLVTAAQQGDLFAQNFYFQGGNPVGYYGNGFQNFTVQDQFLSGLVAAPATTTYDLGFRNALGPIDRHSQSLLVIRMFADQAGLGTDWLRAGEYVFPNLFNLAIAQALRLDGVAGSDSVDEKMRTMIAYSAIDSGDFVFGNSAIRALYDDANELGRLIAADRTAAYLKDPGVLNAIGEIIAEYSGLLAANKALSGTNGNTGLEKGALFYNDTGSRLTVDFSRSLWAPANGISPDEIVGKDTLIENVERIAGTSEAALDEAEEKLWSGNTDNLVKMVAQTTNADGVTLDAGADAQIGTDPQGQPTDGAILVGGDGDNILNGSSGNDLLIGGGGDDTFDGKGGDDLMFGGAGKDTFNLGDGNNSWVDGGADYDTVNYSLTNDSHSVVIGTDAGVTADKNLIVKVTDNSTGGIDYISAVERINLTGQGNSVQVQGLPRSRSDSHTVINLAADSADSGETVNFTQYDRPVYLTSGQVQPGSESEAGGGHAIELFKNPGFTQDTGLGFANFNTLILGNQNSKLDLHSTDDPYLTLVQAGNGNNRITSDIVNLKIDLGSGTNLVEHVAKGTIVNSNGGHDNFVLSDDELITGSTAQDQIFSPGHILLRGAVGRIGSEDPWIVGPDGTRYGLNQQGDLVIEDLLGEKTYVAGYHGGPGVSYSQQTDGIFVGLAQVFAQRLLDLARPYIENIPTMFKLGNELLYTQTGMTFFNSDPLVLDLTGGGINLTALSSASPIFDMRGNGFAVHSGWAEPNDGILVLQQPGHTGTPTIADMFGGPGANGFAALAQHDSDGNGVLDANDAVWSQLRVWVDANGNGVADAGELKTLDQVGVTSINLTATAQTNDTDNGNTITATGAFTFANGASGNIAQVKFNVDTFHSRYQGDTSVSAAAASMPNLKGYGTLTDLRVAMTQDPTLIDLINTYLPNLNGPNLASLRAAALPILLGWARSVPLPDANGNPQVIDPAAGHSDVALLVSVDPDTNTTVDDYAYLTHDNSGHAYWALASHNPVRDQNGNVIALPTFADVLAQPASGGKTWIDLTAAQIGFIERFYGQAFPIEGLTSVPTTPLSVLTDLVNGAMTALNLEAVRLAMQGPLAPYFPGITYNASTDSFSASTEQQLSPMYQAIFAAAPADATGATAWLGEWAPLINVVLGDFARSNSVEVTYGYQFASMVHAYEQSALPLSIEAAAQALGVPAGEVIEGGANVSGPNLPSIYYLHGGDQTVVAGTGLNNFVMGGIFGHDTIIDDETPFTGDDPSILRFTNVASTDVTATRDGLNLILSVNGTNEQVTVENEFNGVRLSFNGANFADNWGVAQITFSDGALWDMPQIAWAVARPQPNLPTILGTPGMDVLDGGVGGNNFLSGGDGSDIYLFGLGYGHDTIHVDRGDPFNNSTDYVKFGSGITMSGLALSRQADSDDLTMTVRSTGDALTILDQFGTGYSLFGPLSLDRIDAFAFADGSTYSWSDVDEMMDAQAKGQPAIYGLDGFNDVLDPGAGVHYISGGNGNKTYIFDFGYSFDTVQDNALNVLAGNNNTIQFGPSVTQQDVKFTLAGNSRDLLITLSDGSTMLVKGEFELDAGSTSFNIIQNFLFDDGTSLTWNQVLQQALADETAGSKIVYGSDYADVLDPGPMGGVHYLSGGDGGGSTDVYGFGHGYGNVTVDVNWTNLLRRGQEVINFKSDVSADQVQWSAVGRDLLIRLSGSDDSLTILGQFAPWFYQGGVTSFAFANGTTFSLAQAASLAFDGSAGGATIDISNEQNLRLGPGIFQCAPGDVFVGSGAVPFTAAGNTFVFDRGNGRNVIVDPAANGISDNIRFGSSVAPDAVGIELLGTSMVFTVSGSNDRIAWIDNGGWSQGATVFNAIGSVSFADGTVWTTSDLVARAHPAPVLSINSVGGDAYEVDYNAANGYAVVSLPFEQHGAATTLRISGLTPVDADIQRVGFPGVDGSAPASAILISPVNSTGAGLLVQGPQFVNDLQFDSIVFDDGTVWSKAAIEQMLVDQASASSGNTEIDGFAGNDVIHAGTGNDILSGGSGNDTYVYQRGDGFASIIVDKGRGSGFTDTLQFMDVASTDVTLAQLAGNDINNLIISASGANGTAAVQVTIENQFGYGPNPADAAINQIVFADGVTWSEHDIETRLVAQQQAQAGPYATIYGFGGSDTLAADAAASTLVGGLGADTYSWSAGDGPTWIADQGSVDGRDSVETDRLSIHGFGPSAVSVARDPTPGAHNLVVTTPGQAPIILQGQTAHQSNSAIELVTFDDGTQWTDTDLLIRADGGVASSPNGTTARSFAGQNANTSLAGTASDDVYFWGAGDGNDTIAEGNYDIWEKADTLKLVGLRSADVRLNIVENDSRDLLITNLATGEKLTVAGQFAAASHDGSNRWSGAGTGIERIEFADGSVWTPQQILDHAIYVGSPGSTSVSNLGMDDGTLPIQASAGVSDIYGRYGVNNTYIWSPGSGSDAIHYQGADTLRLTGVAESDVRLTRWGNTLSVTDAATGETIAVQGEFPDQSSGTGIAQIVFDDGAVWNRGYINANAVVLGTNGNDTYYGTSDSETFDMLAGNDYVSGGGGGDTFIDRPQSGNDTFDEAGLAGDVNTLRLMGVSAANVRLDRSGNDLFVQRLDTGKSVRVDYQFSSSLPNYGVSQIVLDDGTVWNRSVIKANAEIYGTPGDDNLNGTGDPETFDGLGGNDTYYDHTGASDVFVYASSYGNDVIDYQAADTSHLGILRLTDINASGISLTQINNTELYITVAATGKIIHDVNHFSAATRGIGEIIFADGTTWNRATIDANAAPPLTGNPGDYLLTRGSGHVTVFANTITGTIRAPSGVTASDIILQADNAGNLTVALGGSGDSVTLIGDLTQTWWGVASAVSTVTFLDRSTMTIGQPGWGQGQPLTFTWIGTPSITSLVGSNYGSNIFDLGAGGDVVTGGNNSHGGSGVNTLVFDRGVGHAQVNLNGGIGILQVASDIAASDVLLQGDNNGNLTIALKDDAADTVTFSADVGSRWWGVYSALQQINFAADGSSMAVGQPGWGQGQPLTYTWVGTTSNTTLDGSNFASNIFLLGPGGDVLTGGNGSFGGSGVNTIFFDRGVGHAQVNLNGGIGKLQMAADVPASDVILQADNLGNLTVALKDDAADAVTFSGDLHSNWWGVSSALQQINFADGTSLAVAQPGWGQGQPLTFTWIGSVSATTLVGSNYGSNAFNLGPGGDTVTFGNSSLGGSGNNTVVFDRGVGHAQVNLNGGIGTLQVASDIAVSDVMLQADASGNLTIALKDDAADSVTFSGDLSARWWGVYSALQQINFAADNSTMAVGQPGWGQGQPLTFNWLGTPSNTTLTGSNFGMNVFNVGSGGDSVTFGNSSQGGSGTNIVAFDKGDGQVAVNLNGGIGVVQMASDVTAADVYLQANSAGDLTVKLRGTSDSVLVSHDLAQNWWGVSTQLTQIWYSDGSIQSIGLPWNNSNPPATFTWIGTSGNDTLNGSGWGNNVFESGGGNDLINGGGGYDTYKFGTGVGQTAINNFASDHDGSPYGEVDFDSSVSHNQLWFARSGNDLKIDLLGTSSAVTVNNWYMSDTRNQVSTIKAGDGVRVDSQVQQLVSAMATFSANNPSFDPTQSSQMPTDSTLQNALAAAWH